MAEAAPALLQEGFRRHYEQIGVQLPDRFPRREFGFMFFDRDSVHRHLGFSTEAALRRYLVEQVPAHAYHSAAYYERPDAPRMEEKGWLGADLIFDLDADHVPAAQGLSYPEMLAKVKVELRRLVDIFLLGDLGFDPAQTILAFSGGRGYHVHIRDPRVLQLGSHERREIVDYITGTDLDLDWVFPREPLWERRFREFVKTEYRRELPQASDGGWRGRMRAGLEEFLSELERMGEPEAIAQLASAPPEGFRGGERVLRGMYRDLFEARGGSRGVDRLRREDLLEVFSEPRHLDAFLRVAMERVKGRLEGETDEPVTSDIKRLIRLPGSLHGKSSLQVVLLTRDTLDAFEPLRDATSPVFSDRPVRLSLQKESHIELRGEKFHLQPGPVEVPEFAAMFLLARGAASLLDGPSSR